MRGCCFKGSGRWNRTWFVDPPALLLADGVFLFWNQISNSVRAENIVIGTIWERARYTSYNPVDPKLQKWVCSAILYAVAYSVSYSVFLPTSTTKKMANLIRAGGVLP